MCDSPSWIIDKNGKAHWLTDVVAKAAIDACTISKTTHKPLTWEECVGHSAIEQLCGVTGEHMEGRFGLPKKFASDIAAGRYTRLARAGRDTAIKHIPDLLPESLQKELGIMLADDDGVYVVVDRQVLVVTRGKPTITQQGGDLSTWDQSKPTITQQGGDLRTWDQSNPTITQRGGYLRTCGQSKPTITQQGGYLSTCDQSKPTITQQGGDLRTWGQSKPTIKKAHPAKRK